MADFKLRFIQIQRAAHNFGIWPILRLAPYFKMVDLELQID